MKTQQKRYGNYFITQMTTPRESGRDHSLHPLLTVHQINKQIGKAICSQESGDNKVTKRWNVSCQNIETGKVTSFFIWDYKGERWSASGDLEALRAVFGNMNVVNDQEFSQANPGWYHNYFTETRLSGGQYIPRQLQPLPIANGIE